LSLINFELFFQLNNDQLNTSISPTNSNPTFLFKRQPHLLTFITLPPLWLWQASFSPSHLLTFSPKFLPPSQLSDD
jgi:hypothetical protein